MGFAPAANPQLSPEAEQFLRRNYRKGWEVNLKV